ncbi:D-sedoheptulose 7-phosphate isomerase [Campylobacter sp. 2018MI35]|uniref:D-sedoheptulose 7-phosphate isomerase n=1 Tax=Campylobacter molothri TaxID=1032242 RepID=UPI0019030122|nr:D-sedoheptulose 7-phosphate isomerase [Campylobacter sp. 2018MI35]MBZ7930625.1 D-sedoheptulose 7-phosphate isomerase [Campylobacter sp. W0067]MBZ7934993.1 D-sedoheptulose 7-phosphate isomerase [Campylobacter sp. W0065]MBZ7944392.1 D-sedoheptulose 7-phosphate isomerase [Campylobacter sp. RM13744]MBZ7947320.1 D-sedoheptulose 7-phosphate isomerase [Campylobacter sp. RM10536]MBZ7953218.1 D-sedoheptulose 7-phosphate isomerase [Campylobacter sp. RM9939]MBZ7957584.1 D-sedoheptulose 7-phosphate is
MENINSYIKGHFKDSILTKEQILKDENLIKLIKNVSLEVIKAYKNGNKTLIAGNGGSAADAQHIAGEFVSRFYFDRPGIASIALTTDTSILTAIGNDYGYENIFSRQVEAQGVKGDVFIGISTSGNSKNILKALESCKKKEILSIGLTGESGGAMDKMCDYCIKVPSSCTPRIQESHIIIGHILCAIVEEELFGKGFGI